MTGEDNPLVLPIDRVTTRWFPSMPSRDARAFREQIIAEIESELGPIKVEHGFSWDNLMHAPQSRIEEEEEQGEPMVRFVFDWRPAP